MLLRQQCGAAHATTMGERTRALLIMARSAKSRTKAQIAKAVARLRAHARL